jgi:LuxR family maltose regulon positive regulatory protein
LLNRNAMVDPRTISKITLPDLSRAIPRPRLIQRAIDAGAARMILITGQAAQGKSTLAAEIARQPGPACAWMHLDPPDSDPVNFFHLLVHSLKASRPARKSPPF